MDHEPGSRVRPKKGARDRLIRLLQSHPDWALGFQDETWWSRLAHPNLFAWTPEDRPLRLIEQTIGKNDPDPKALACYGILLRLTQPNGSPDSVSRSSVGGDYIVHWAGCQMRASSSWPCFGS